MKCLFIFMIVVIILIIVVYVGDMDIDSISNKWEKGVKDVWIDGKVEVMLLFNGNFDLFDINIDVKNGNVVFIGKVENFVDKKLVEELVVNIDGVMFVDNKLMVVFDKDMEGDMLDDVEDIVDEGISELIDVKIVIVIKICFFMDIDILGFDIDVDVENGVVILIGDVDFDVECDLVVEIVKNVFDVKDVESNFCVVIEIVMN